MKLEDITTLEQAESLAYREMKVVQTAQTNLQLLEQRIMELRDKPHEPTNEENKEEES